MNNQLGVGVDCYTLCITTVTARTLAVVGSLHQSMGRALPEHRVLHTFSKSKSSTFRLIVSRYGHFFLCCADVVAAAPATAAATAAEAAAAAEEDCPAGDVGSLTFTSSFPAATSAEGLVGPSPLVGGEISSWARFILLVAQAGAWRQIGRTPRCRDGVPTNAEFDVLKPPCSAAGGVCGSGVLALCTAGASIAMFDVGMTEVVVIGGAAVLLLGEENYRLYSGRKILTRASRDCTPRCNSVTINATTHPSENEYVPLISGEAKAMVALVRSAVGTKRYGTALSVFRTDMYLCTDMYMAPTISNISILSYIPVQCISCSVRSAL